MSDALPSRSNVPEFSVGDLAFSLKKTIEEQYGRVRVRGELSRVSIAGSGHMYSALKDENAVIDAVCWKGTFAKLALKPEEGLEVIVTGRVSTYPQRSNYQLVIEEMELAGEGALLKMLEERKKKLAAEGLFAAERKKPLPYLPEVIGVVTSPTGAVIRDILHRLNDRFPRRVIVWPVLVQGDGAAKQVADAINGFQTLSDHGYPQPDLLIVARGGGSLEDLMPFNEEVVIRAVSQSNIPVISAVGHETDTTLCDLVADMRAPTPTGAAEIAVPVRAELRALVMDDGQRLYQALMRRLDSGKERTDQLGARLGDPKRLLEGYVLRVDHINSRLDGIFAQFIYAKQRLLLECASQLRSPRDLIHAAGQRVDFAKERLGTRMRTLLNDHSKRVQHAGKMLNAYSVEGVLSRGFAVVRQNSKVIKRAEELKNGDHISLLFTEREVVEAVVGGQQESSSKLQDAKKKAPKAPESKETTQTSLF